MTATALPASTRIAFIGGGNMLQQHGVTALPAAGPQLAGADLFVWAV